MNVTSIYGSYNTLYHYYPSDSANSYYIPIHALRNGKLIRKGDQKVLLYDLTMTTGWYRTPYPAKLIRNMEYADCTPMYYNKLVNHFYYTDKGQLIDYVDKVNPNVLVQLCVRKEDLFTIGSRNVEEYKMCCLVDYSLKEHKFYKSVDKNYIEQLHRDIVVVYTHNLLQRCYNTRINAPVARTLVEYMDQCNSINNLLTNAYA